MFRQPNLAATLRALVAAEAQARSGGATREQAIVAGRDAFYKGSIATRMTAAVRAAGGVMTDDDLATYRGKVEEPATVPYRGFTVHKAGFWNQGPALLQTLRILEGFDLARMGQGSADATHTIVEAVKLAYADRDRYYADPDFARVPGPALLSAEYATVRRALIDPAHASIEQRPGDPERGAARIGTDTPVEAGLASRPDSRLTTAASTRSQVIPPRSRLPMRRETCFRPRRVPDGSSAAPLSRATPVCR